MKRIFSTLFAASCVMLTSSSAIAQTARARVPDTPIRVDANLASPTLATLHEGDRVDVIDAQGAWYRVLVPGSESKPQVGYVMARLVEIADGDGSAPRAGVSAIHPATQGSQIPPTSSQIQQQRTSAAAAAREQALKSEVDTLQARVDALQNGRPIAQPDVDEIQQIQRPASAYPQKREGVWFSVGGGLGTIGCRDCDDETWNGFSGGLSVGKTITDRLLLGVGTTGFFRSGFSGNGTGSVADGRVRFYPSRTTGFFLTGGMGLGAIGFSSGYEYGVSVIFGVGWDLRVAPNVSLTPFWNGIGVATSNRDASVGQVGIGITIH